MKAKKMKERRKVEGKRAHRECLVLLVDRDEALEALDRDVLDKGVETAAGVGVLGASAGETDTDADRGVLDAAAPESLVHRGVETHIRKTHLTTGKLLDGLHSTRSTLLELDLVHVLMDVDGADTRNSLVIRHGNNYYNNKNKQTKKKELERRIEPFLLIKAKDSVIL